MSILVKKIVIDGQSETLESIFRFLDNVEYIDNIPKHDSFWFELAFYGNGIENFWEHVESNFKTQELIPYLKSKQAKLAICYMREYPFAHNEWVQMQSKIGEDACNKFDIDPKQIYYFYGNKPTELESFKQTDINVIDIPYFEIDFVHRVNQGEIEYISPYEAERKNPSRTFLDMNGKPNKYMRLRHVVHMWNKRIIDHGIINLYQTDEDRRIWETEDYRNLVIDLINDKDWEKFLKWWPQSHDSNEGLYGKHHCGYPYDRKLFEDTFMSVVAETHSGARDCNSQFFISEKIVKAIGNCHPFVILSTPDYLKELQKLGYKTFSPYFNESYDSEKDAELRMIKAVDEVERICKNGVPIKAIETAMHNQSLLFERYNATIKRLKEIIT